MDLLVLDNLAAVGQPLPGQCYLPGVMGVASHNDIGVRQPGRHSPGSQGAMAHHAPASRAVEELQPEPLVLTMPLDAEVDPTPITASVNMVSSLGGQALAEPLSQVSLMPFADGLLMVSTAHDHE